MEDDKDTNRIVYHEIVLAGDDDEATLPSGAVVTLSYWDSSDWRMVAHYTLHITVMIDRETVKDEITYIRARYNRDDPKYIRRAIAALDAQLALYPVLANPGDVTA